MEDIIDLPSFPPIIKYQVLISPISEVVDKEMENNKT